MSPWSGSRPLENHHHWTLIEIRLGYPAAVLSHGDPAVIIAWNQSLHKLKQVIDGVDVIPGMWF